MFSKQSIINSDKNSLYKNRVSRSSNLFSEDTEVDDTFIDDLTLANELISYEEKPKMDTWKTRKEKQTTNIFNDTKEEEEEKRITSLLETVDEIADKEKNITKTSLQKDDDISVNDINKEIEDLILKLGPKEDKQQKEKITDVDDTFNISAYISSNTSDSSKGLFD